MKSFRVNIITQEKTAFDAEAVSLVAPGGLGYLGVLPDHAPLLTTITEGKLTLRLKNDTLKEFTVTGGFMEVRDNFVTILPDQIKEL